MPYIDMMGFLKHKSFSMFLNAIFHSNLFLIAFTVQAHCLVSRQLRTILSAIYSIFLLLFYFQIFVFSIVTVIFKIAM